MTQQRINMGKISTEYLGDWNSESSYDVFDVVTYNGAVYMAYKSSTGEYPDYMSGTLFSSYAVNNYWTTEIAFLRPRITTANTCVQFLQAVSRNGKLRYANTYGVDYTSQYFSDPAYMRDVIDFTKGY